MLIEVIDAGVNKRINRNWIFESCIKVGFWSVDARPIDIEYLLYSKGMLHLL